MNSNPWENNCVSLSFRPSGFPHTSNIFLTVDLTSSSVIDFGRLGSYLTNVWCYDMTKLRIGRSGTLGLGSLSSLSHPWSGVFSRRIPYQACDYCSFFSEYLECNRQSIICTVTRTPNPSMKTASILICQIKLCPSFHTRMPNSLHNENRGKVASPNRGADHSVTTKDSE